MENEDTNWTNQTTQETDEYCSGIYSIIHNNKSGVTMGYRYEEIECIREKFEYTMWIWLYLTESLTHGFPINIAVQNQLPDVQPTQTSSDR